MSSRRHILLTALVLLATAPAWSDTVVLKQEAFVKGPKVMLGDVADIEGEARQSLEAVELASAALPGDSRRLNASLIISRVKSAGIPMSDLTVTGARTTIATTLHQEVPQAAITESLRSYIESEMPWPVENAEIEIVAPEKRVLVPEGDANIAWRATCPQYEYMGAGVFRGSVIVDDQPYASVLCRAIVEPYADVMVARYDIPRGKLIGASDLCSEKRRLSELRSGVFQSPEALEGFVARATIFPGQVITSRKVAPRKIVKRNQLVAVEAHVGTLKLQGRAKVLSDACAGDRVICVNLDSKEEFQGIVREDGVIIVK